MPVPKVAGRAARAVAGPVARLPRAGWIAALGLVCLAVLFGPPRGSRATRERTPSAPAQPGARAREGGSANAGAAPTADRARWRHVFAEDFSTPAPTFPGRAYAARWWAYPSRWTDTSGSVGRPAAERGRYDCARTCSVAGGVLRLNLHSERGIPYVAAPVPRLPGSSGGVGSMPSGQRYGRYSVRFRATANGPGYKAAWLLWPDSEKWPADGEIDFPEGSLDAGFAGFVHHRGARSGSDQKRVPSSGSGATFGAWHVATVEWSPGKVAFLLDGRRLGTETSRVPNTPMHWVLQSETEVRAAPIPDASRATVEIDWVSVWRWAGGARSAR